VTLSPRALLGAVPALIVLAGSFLLSREYLAETDRSNSWADGEARAHGETVQWPTAQDEDRLHRVALKQETVDDLMDGRLTLEEAVARFEMLSAAAESSDSGAVQSPGNTPTERAVHQVLSYAHVRASREAERLVVPLARVESEAEAFLARVRMTH
jgi:hypothetical protein